MKTNNVNQTNIEPENDQSHGMRKFKKRLIERERWQVRERKREKKIDNV